jgi:flavin reductase (DIM6/NTAB) family NADH-FMN oxidoreductase RutF
MMRPITELLDLTELRRVYGCFPSGVAAVCAIDGNGVPDGMAVSSFTPVSLDPPLVSVCMQHTSTTWPRLRRAPHLGISVLAEGQEDLARSLAAKSGNRFAGVGWTATEDGAVLIEEAAAWLDCRVEADHTAGDHMIVLLRVLSLFGDPARPPLVFHGSRFRMLTTVG